MKPAVGGRSIGAVKTPGVPPEFVAQYREGYGNVGRLISDRATSFE
jgi:hypothetical protein